LEERLVIPGYDSTIGPFSQYQLDGTSTHAGSKSWLGQQHLDGYIDGYVQLPGDQPARRRVYLFREARPPEEAGAIKGNIGLIHTVLVDWAWSDEATGYWRFENVSTSGFYTVIVFDHTAQYAPVMSAGLKAKQYPPSEYWDR
jgi:hypothetical protein